MLLLFWIQRKVNRTGWGQVDWSLVCSKALADLQKTSCYIQSCIEIANNAYHNECHINFINITKLADAEKLYCKDIESQVQESSGSAESDNESEAFTNEISETDWCIHCQVEHWSIARELHHLPKIKKTHENSWEDHHSIIDYLTDRESRFVTLLMHFRIYCSSKWALITPSLRINCHGWNVGYIQSFNILCFWLLYNSNLLPGQVVDLPILTL